MAIFPPKHTKLWCWSGWYYLLNLVILWLIASQYLPIILNGYGDAAAPTSLNELTSHSSNFYIWALFIFFAYTGYIAVFLIMPALLTMFMSLLRFPKWLFVTITISTLAFVMLYLIADTRIYSMYHYHINGVILRMFLSGDVVGVFDFSLLEWSLFIGTGMFMFAVQCGVAYFAWKLAQKYNSKRFIIYAAIITSLFVAFSLQIFFYASLHLYFAKFTTALLVFITVMILFKIWIKRVVQPVNQNQLYLLAVPIAAILFTIIIGTLLANYAPKQVIIILVAAFTLTAGILFNSKLRHLLLPLCTLLLACAMVLYQLFIMEYVPAMRQIIEASYLFPLYDSFAATILSYTKHGKSFYMLNNGYFMQPKGVNTPLRYPLQAMQYAKSAKNYNILMIVIDTWRYDTVTPSITPNIYQFAQTAWQYQNHWSGGNATQSGMFSLFYGLPSNYWTAMLNQKQGPVLIKELLKKNYHVNVFSSSELAIPALYKTVFLDVPNLKIMADGDYIFVRDQNVNREFFDFLNSKNRTDKPFFSVLFYDGAHGYCADGNPVHKFQPEMQRCGRLLLNNNSNPESLKNRYLNALYKIDGLVGDVLQQLKSHQLLDNTIVIIAGDHGEEFNDNHLNYWAHASNYTKYQVQTPFIMHWPHSKPQVITSRTSHYDVAPTLLHQVLGCSTSVTDYTIGQDMLANSHPRPYLLVGSYNSYAVIEDDRITQILPDGNFMIYDHAFRPLNNATLRTGIMSMAVHDMTRYYAK